MFVCLEAHSGCFGELSVVVFSCSCRPRSDKMEYKLIMAVSSFPSLYDSSSLTYRDLNMRSDAWRQVAHIVGVHESECRRKWKMLRDQHRRERQREKERRESGVGLLNYRPWRYSAILSFLNPFIDARAAGTNGWALDPQPSRLQASDAVGCSTTTETRSDDDDSYGIAIADATTTTAASSSSSSEFVQRKRPSSDNRNPVRLKETKAEETSGTAATDDTVQTQQVQQVNVRELFEMMMQSVTSLATSLASSQSSSQPSDQLMPPDLQHLQTPSRLNHLKTEEQEATAEELLDQTDGEEDCRAVSPRPTRAWRRSADSLLEEHLRRMEAREAQRERDTELRDDVTLFLLSLAPAVRRLPVEKQSWVRAKIQQFVHEAEFGPTNFH
uniref:transcription factor Adf-1-like n=1 Tax=Scatophagus argus TaxID=75038 RepID=UPI001ED7DD36|nr:transcription factor Adf-1-like [Scatophagus argus]